MQDIIDQLKKMYEPQHIPGGTTTNIGETALLAKLIAEALERMTKYPITNSANEIIGYWLSTPQADTPTVIENKDRVGKNDNGH